MAPSVTLDVGSDFNNGGKSAEPPSSARTLLLSPPSLSSHPEALDKILTKHPRETSDVQMLDRLSLGLVSLPESTYDEVLILTDPDGTRSESSKLLSRDVLGRIVHALKTGGRLRSQDETFASENNVDERNESILAGLVLEGGDGAVKPDHAAIQSVPLRLNRKSNGAAPSATATVPEAVNGKRKSTDLQNGKPIGVGFVDFSDDFGEPMDEGDDDELIDEDTLLGDDDLGAPIVQPPECRPKAGKRRRACKDCTCGLKQKIEAEDASTRSNADSTLEKMKLGADDLAEVDFTVQGKVGSCGNCSLGDAFRCDGCPYIGLPAFKPGEEVRLLNNDVQL
ncbi:MAG: hypothetical protein M4579_006014 [Chaenotheca gracillima]|nr:MAG: hypothetical protein M4579_006014 [Chaenotheca gracillima]